MGKIKNEKLKNSTQTMWKIEYVHGSFELVQLELKKQNLISYLLWHTETQAYLAGEVSFSTIYQLKTILKAYQVEQDDRFTPRYIANHKSRLGNLVSWLQEMWGEEFYQEFHSFSIQCAGKDSPEVRSIITYIEEVTKLVYDDLDPDLKCYIIKIEDTWEIGVQIAARPVSMRDYRVEHMPGALNASIAYGMNLLADVGQADSYCNPCAGSGTLALEAALANPHLSSVQGFDLDTEALTLAMHNITQAGLQSRIHLSHRDLCDIPDLGCYDVIASDLPFGMGVAKYADLDFLYRSFFWFARKNLAPQGRLVVITSQSDVFCQAMSETGFGIEAEITLRSMTSANDYLETYIYLCMRKQIHYIKNY